MSTSVSIAENTILILHDPALDPRAFLTRLISSLEPLTEEETSIPWRIDNKYYTADVRFRLLELDTDTLHVEGGGAPVVLYLFGGKPPDPVPPGLTRLVIGSVPDISLAIRVRILGTPAADERETDGGPSDEVGETFAEMGMEFIDESALPEADDERPVDALDSVRQTIMTHMWAGMVRKPVGSDAFPPDGRLADNGSEDLAGEGIAEGDEDEEEEQEAGAGPSRFPITFLSSIGRSDPLDLSSAASASSTAFGATNSEKTDFPGVEELRSQLSSHEGAGSGGPDFNGLGRLGVMDQELDLGLEEEWERLDDWLGAEEGFVPLDDGEEGSDGVLDMDQMDRAERVDDNHPPHLPPRGATVDHEPITEEPDEQEPRVGAVSAHPRPDQRETGFEDDFDDFAAFQCAPPPSSISLPAFRPPSHPDDDPTHSRPRGQPASGSLSLDPTSLLLHLQAVRAELAGLGDEDQRRIRAGREVAHVMWDLGMGGADNELGESGGMDDLLGI